MREIRIPLYGIIQLDDLEWEVVNSRPFQRLRRIKQLAFSDYVYPGAVHTRFEHSLGVMHLVTQAFDRMREKREVREMLESPEGLAYSATTWEIVRRILRLAALTHDWGHMPFSHAGESVMPENPNKPKKKDGVVVGYEKFDHEDYSFALIRQYLPDVLENHKLNDEDIRADDIADFIQGKTSRSRLVKAAPWRGLVKGELDCDRMDYLRRDSHHLGVEYGRFDVDRVLSTLTLTDQGEDGLVQLAVEEGGLLAAESLILARYYMFVQVYFHKVRRFLDRMYAQSLGHVYTASPLQPPVNPDGTLNQAGLEDYLTRDDWEVQSLMLNAAREGHSASQAVVLRECWKVAIMVDDETDPAKLGVRLDEAVKRLDDNGLSYLRDDGAETGTQKFKKANILVVGDAGFTGVRRIDERSHVAMAMPEKILIGRIFVPKDTRSAAKDLLSDLLQRPAPGEPGG